MTEKSEVTTIHDRPASFLHVITDDAPALSAHPKYFQSLLSVALVTDVCAHGCVFSLLTREDVPSNTTQRFLDCEVRNGEERAGFELPECRNERLIVNSKVSNLDEGCGPTEQRQVPRVQGLEKPNMYREYGPCAE